MILSHLNIIIGLGIGRARVRAHTRIPISRTKVISRNQAFGRHAPGLKEFQLITLIILGMQTVQYYHPLISNTINVLEVRPLDHEAGAIQKFSSFERYNRILRLIPTTIIILEILLYCNL